MLHKTITVSILSAVLLLAFLTGCGQGSTSIPVNKPNGTEMSPIEAAAETYIKEQQKQLEEQVGKSIDIASGNFNYIGAEISANDLKKFLEKAKNPYTLSVTKKDSETATVSVTIKSTDMEAVCENMSAMKAQLQSAVAESPDDNSIIINLLNELLDSAPTIENTIEMNLIKQDGIWIVPEDSNFDMFLLFVTQNANFNSLFLTLSMYINNENTTSQSTGQAQNNDVADLIVITDWAFKYEVVVSRYSFVVENRTNSVIGMAGYRFALQLYDENNVLTHNSYIYISPDIAPGGKVKLSGDIVNDDMEEAKFGIIVLQAGNQQYASERWLLAVSDNELNFVNAGD